MPIGSECNELRSTIRRLVDGSGLTQKECAALIHEHSGRPCPERTLRTWLADEDASSARNPQKWAVDALKAALAERKKRKKA